METSSSKSKRDRKNLKRRSIALYENIRKYFTLNDYTRTYFVFVCLFFFFAEVNTEVTRGDERSNLEKCRISSEVYNYLRNYYRYRSPPDCDLLQTDLANLCKWSATGNSALIPRSVSRSRSL